MSSSIELRAPLGSLFLSPPTETDRGRRGQPLHQGSSHASLDGCDRVPCAGRREFRSALAAAVRRCGACAGYGSCVRQPASCRLLTLSTARPVPGRARTALSASGETKHLAGFDRRGDGCHDASFSSRLASAPSPACSSRITPVLSMPVATTARTGRCSSKLSSKIAPTMMLGT